MEYMVFRAHKVGNLTIHIHICVPNLVSLSPRRYGDVKINWSCALFVVSYRGYSTKNNPVGVWPSLDPLGARRHQARHRRLQLLRRWLCPALVVHVQRYALVKQGSEGHEYAAEQLTKIVTQFQPQHQTSLMQQSVVAFPILVLVVRGVGLAAGLLDMMNSGSDKGHCC
uniref:Uncharacterized protein n=1 Tax=Oryza rufipogon TaxID=4529 RepID=A0A0E0PVA1_ORYRU